MAHAKWHELSAEEQGEVMRQAAQYPSERAASQALGIPRTRIASWRRADGSKAPARPSRAVGKLLRQLATEHPDWGQVKVRRRLAELGHMVGKTYVDRGLRALRGARQVPQWRAASSAAEMVARFRAEFGLSQAAFARVLGYRGRTKVLCDRVRRWERGEAEPEPYLRLALVWLGRVLKERRRGEREDVQGRDCWRSPTFPHG